MRRTKTALVALVILMASLFVSDIGFDTLTTRASATTLNVGTGPGNDSATIQGAIDLAEEGDTIFVHSGEYFEDADPLTALKINKIITILGEDKYTTIINATGKKDGIYLTNTDYVNISGFTVEGSNSYNIKLENSNFTHIHDNIVKGSNFCALGISPGSENLIENNLLTENLQGVIISGHSSANILRNNVINPSGNRAVTIQNGANDNLISHNMVSGYDIGIYIYESENNCIENNQISNCDEGLRILVLDNCLLVNSTISNNNIAVKVQSASATIINCNLQGSIQNDIWEEDPDLVGTDVTLINTTFDENKVSLFGQGSTLTVQWYLHIKVIDEADEPVAGIIVRVRDNPNGTFDENYTTGSEGSVNWIALTQFRQDITNKVYYTPHNITAHNTTSLGYALPEVLMGTSTEITVKVFSDADGDGVFDVDDAFPEDPTQWVDSDGDGYGDNASGNDPDAFPNDPKEWKDTDGDGVGDNSDAFPDDPKEWKDSDGDGIGDNSDFLPSVHNSVFFLIIGIAVIVIIIILALIISKRRKKPAKWGEEEQMKD